MLPNSPWRLNAQAIPISKTLLAFSCAFFLVIFAISIAAYTLSTRQINHAFVEQQLAIASETIKLRLAMAINSDLSLVRKLADTPLIRQYFMNPADTALATAASAEFAGYQQHFSDQLVFWVNDTDKIVHSTSSEPYHIDPNDPASYWYDMTLYWTEQYNFTIHYNPALKQRRLWINAPVFIEQGRGLKKAVGMLGTGISLTDFSRFVTSAYINFDNNITAYIFNKSNEITSATNPALTVNKVSIIDHLGDAGAEVIKTARTLADGESANFIYGDNMYLVSSIPAMKWYLVTTYPLPSLLAVNPAMNMVFFGMLCLIFFIFIAVNIFIGRSHNTLAEQNIKLLEASRNAQAASLAKSEFLAKMSHEIRTPMNAVIGITELIMREELPAAVHTHILTLKQAGANLLSLINDILDFSKIETGKLELVKENYLLSSLINDVISIIRMRVIDSQVRFVANIDCNIPNELFGDEIRIRQILLNLLSNAVKYTETGFVAFTVSGEIRDDSTVILTMEVSDSGKGIKQEDLAVLFNDFVQLELAKNKGIEGTGLGLAITRNIIQAMEGDIAVHSVYGKGSTFTVTLPQTLGAHKKLASVENPQEKSVLVYERREIYANSIACTVDNLGVECRLVTNDDEFHEKIAAKAYSFVFVAAALFKNVKNILQQLGSDASIVLLTGFGELAPDKDLNILAMPAYAVPIANILNGVADSFAYGISSKVMVRFTAPDATVLIVDDISTNLIVAEGLLSPYKMRIDLCKSGMEAIGKIQANNYDLIFMDHMMPQMDGIEAVARIRAFDHEDQYYKNVPIIALTANTVAGTKEMFLKNGFNDFLPKPIDMIELNAILERWIPQDKQRKLLTEEHDEGPTVKTADAGKTIEINGLDIMKGIAMAGGTSESYLRTLAAFHKDGLEKIEQIRTYLKAGDMPLFVTYVHALKSASASIGACELSETANNLETAGKQGNFAFIEAHTTQFLTALEALLRNINAALSTNKRGERQDSANLEILQVELIKLKTALGMFDSGAIDGAVNNLQAFSQAAEIGASIETILENTLIGEYDVAIVLIDALLQRYA